MKATFVADVSKHYNGHAELFLLNKSAFINGSRKKYNHIVVSAIDNGVIAETYIFPADRNGFVKDFSELPGSYKGGTDIDVALLGGGYEIVRGTNTSLLSNDYEIIQ